MQIDLLQVLFSSLINYKNNFIINYYYSYSQLFQLSQKFGPFGKAFLRSTFFEQFVGGENAKEMRKVVGSLQQRGLKVMVVSVLEEDVEDEREDGYNIQVT